jgi:broad specificity phosphatase PhoE
MPKLLVCRHGQTEWNVQRIMQGHTDTGLDSLGILQAQLLGRWFAAEFQETRPPRVVYASSLSRAKDTAVQVINGLQGGTSKRGVSLVLDDRLREVHLGMFQGLTATQAKQKHPASWTQYMYDDDFVIPQGGESTTQFRQRVLDCVNEIIAREEKEEVIVIVTHGGVVDMLRREFAPDSAGARCGNCSVSVFEVCEDKGLRLVDWNLTDHLHGSDGGGLGADDSKA